MARAIDADALQEMCDRRIQDTWNSGTAPASWSHAYAEFKDDIDSVPTLTSPDDPLTIEQLLEMDGEPVYIIAKGVGIAEWNVIKGKAYITLAYDQPTIGFQTVTEGIEFINGRTFRIDSYGVTWIAYHRPPEGEDDEKTSD